MPKCGGCGKFLAVNETVKCPKCPGSYHRACVNLTATANISPSWMCPGCKAKQPRTDNSQTPVKGVEERGEQTASEPLTLVSPQAVTVVNSGRIPVDQEVSLAMEIRCLRGEVNALRDEVRAFREEMSGLKDTVQTCSDRVDALEGRVNSVEEKCKQAESPRLSKLETAIGELKHQLNEREQETLLNDLQLTGVTETKGENPTQLINVLAVKLGMQLDERDVVFVKRVGTVLRDRSDGEDASRPRIIVVRLARRASRDCFLSAARVRRNLTTADIQVPGVARRIYINERLTKNNRQLFYMTRQAAIRSEWKYAWTKDGRILARKEEGKSVVHVRQEADIAQVFGNQDV